MKNQSKTLNFFRRNAAYIVLALCVLAIGLTAALVTVTRSNMLDAEDDARQQAQVDNTTDVEENENPTSGEEQPETPVAKMFSFIIPVERTTAVEDYSDGLVYNATLKRYEAHKAMDFFAEQGTPVYAAEDGVITDINTTLLTGTTVTIDHGNGVYTVYNSLADGDMVFVGQTVKQGAQIGEVSSSNRQEASEGAHLHFYVLENGETINPAKYLASAEK